jgi:PAS domain S-box-containing protein
LAEVLVPYFKAGLEEHELCIWVTSQPLPVDAAKQALQQAVPDLDCYFAAGQIEILDYSQWYMLSDHFDAERVLQAWIDKVAEARRRGYTGLRLTGNTFWLEKDDWRAFTDYEASINRVISNYPMIALCSYSLDKCGASEVLDVVANHQFALARREGQWEELQSADRRRSKEVLQQAYAELEGRIKARTAELELEKAALADRELILSHTATRLRDEIAERSRMEAELRRASLYVRSLIEASLDPLVTISPEGIVTDVNQATEEVTGVARQHLIGTDFSDYFTEPEKAREGYQSVLSRGFVRDYPLTIRHASGRTIEVLYNATLYRNESGEVEGVFAAARDITERKQAEDEMRKASLYARSLIEASLDPLVTISP